MVLLLQPRRHARHKWRGRGNQSSDRAAPISIRRCTEQEIFDVDTLERKAIDGNTAVIVLGLVIEKVRTDVSFYYVGYAYWKKRMIVDDHGNLRCASSSRP